MFAKHLQHKGKPKPASFVPLHPPQDPPKIRNVFLIIPRSRARRMLNRQVTRQVRTHATQTYPARESLALSVENQAETKVLHERGGNQDEPRKDATKKKARHADGQLQKTKIPSKYRNTDYRETILARDPNNCFKSISPTNKQKNYIFKWSGQKRPKGPNSDQKHRKSRPAARARYKKIGISRQKWEHECSPYFRGPVATINFTPKRFAGEAFASAPAPAAVVQLLVNKTCL